MTCRACGATGLSLVFAMEPMPLAGAFASTQEAALAAERYPLEWWRCRYCGLVNVAPDIPDAAIYSDYSYRASYVPALVRHHREFAAWLAERFPRTRRMLEVGGNDGVLLRELPDNWERTNSDPSDVALDCGFPVLPAWDAILGRAHRAEYDLITSSNALGHFTDIGGALDGIRWALKDDGAFVVEVHDLAATLRTGQWDTIYHEHKAEWSLEALRSACAVHGLHMTRSETLELHGGLLRAVFVKDDPRSPTRAPAPDFRHLSAVYRDRRPVGARWAYGAAARATVYLNQTAEPVEAVFDDSPRRAGRYVPGTGTPILPPGDMSDLPGPVLITAWTQAEDIRAAHPEYRGEWVTAW